MARTIRHENSAQIIEETKKLRRFFPKGSTGSYRIQQLCSVREYTITDGNIRFDLIYSYSEQWLDIPDAHED